MIGSTLFTYFKIAMIANNLGGKYYECNLDWYGPSSAFE